MQKRKYNHKCTHCHRGMEVYGDTRKDKEGKPYCGMCPLPIREEDFGVHRDKPVIICRRMRSTDNYIYTSVHFEATQSPVPHNEKHSPDGFEWGYSGSGPADLACSILSVWYGKVGECPSLYQDFKAAFIAELNQEEGGKIHLEEVDEWYEDWLSCDANAIAAAPYFEKENE